MDFIKKHYEKILLGVVLLSLAVAVVALPFYINSQKQDLIDKRTKKLNANIKQLTNVDETRFTAAYQRLENPGTLNLSKPHNLFNPVPWQKKADGTLIKVEVGNEVGPDALKVTKVNPIYTTIKFESIGPSGSNFLVTLTRDADPDPKKRRKRSSYFERGTKSDFMSLVDVKGPSDKPELVMALNDTGAKIVVSADRPYQRVDGYSVDLQYDPEKGVWPGRRVNDKVAFTGDEFVIKTINLIATNQFEVVLSAKSTGKNTTVKYNPEM